MLRSVQNDCIRHVGYECCSSWSDFYLFILNGFCTLISVFSGGEKQFPKYTNNYLWAVNGII